MCIRDRLADRAFVYPNEAINFTVKVRNVGNTPLNTVTVSYTHLDVYKRQH